MDDNNSTEDKFSFYAFGLAFGGILFYFTFFKTKETVENVGGIIFFMMSIFSSSLILVILWLILQDLKDFIRNRKKQKKPQSKD